MASRSSTFSFYCSKVKSLFGRLLHEEIPGPIFCQKDLKSLCTRWGVFRGFWTLLAWHINFGKVHLLCPHHLRFLQRDSWNLPPYGCYGILWLDVFVWSSAKCLRVFTHLAQQTLTWTFQHRCAQTGNTSPGFPSGTGLVLRAQLQCRNMCLADVCLVYLYQKKCNQLQHKKSKQTKRGKTSKIFEKQPCFFLSLSLSLCLQQGTLTKLFQLWVAQQAVIQNPGR